MFRAELVGAPRWTFAGMQPSPLHTLFARRWGQTRQSSSYFTPRVVRSPLCAGANPPVVRAERRSRKGGEGV
jgi:hypothetical protein